MNQTRQYRLLELFCGPGGIASAALQSGISGKGGALSILPVWANDIDEDTCRTYARNIKSSELEEVSDTVVCGDVRNVISQFDNVDYNALAFGFPCNDFSMVGETKGINGSYGPLYSYGVAAINAGNPEWFMAENVGGLRNANDGSAFTTILHDLENAGKEGYSLSAHLYKFEEYGVPQARHRIIIIGIRKDLSRHFRIPAPTTKNAEHQISCRNAIEKPPIDQHTPNNELTRQSSTVVKRLMCLPPGANAWFIDRVLKMENEALANTMLNVPTFAEAFPDAKNAYSIRKILESVRLNVKSARMSHIYRRLEPDRPSYTITGSGGGGTHVYHWKEPRALTNRERARLQTFDDNFEFVGKKESVRKQIGMAVPPKGAKQIFDALLKTMANENYPDVPANLYETGEEQVRIGAVLEDAASLCG